MGRVVRARAARGHRRRGDRSGGRRYVAVAGSPRPEPRISCRSRHDTTTSDHHIGSRRAHHVNDNSPTTIVVYVAGAVAAPGVYTLAAGARVTDAVDRRGRRRPPMPISTSSTWRQRFTTASGSMFRRSARVIPAVVADAPAPDSTVPAGSGQRQLGDGRSVRRVAGRRSGHGGGDRRPSRVSTARSKPSTNWATCAASARPSSKRCAAW